MAENVVIIGSGPAAHTAAIYAARANLSPRPVRGLPRPAASPPAASSPRRPTSRTSRASPRASAAPSCASGSARSRRASARASSPRRSRGRSARSARSAFKTDEQEGEAQRAHHRDRRDRQARRHPGHARRRAVAEGRVGVRGVRRRAADVPQQAAVRDRRRRLGDGGGRLPHEVRVEGLPRPPPRRAARLGDHAGARAREPEDRVPAVAPGDAGRGRPQRRVGPRAGSQDRAASARSRPPACSSRSATCRTPRSSAARSRATSRATSSRLPAPRTTCVPGRVRRRRRPGQEVPPGDHGRRHRLHARRSRPSTSCPRTRNRNRPEPGRPCTGPPCQIPVSRVARASVPTASPRR